MKVLVDLEILQKYLPENEIVKITEEHKARCENHKNYVKNWRENHKVECENHNETCENGSKIAFLGENHARRGEGGFLSFNTCTSTLNGTVTDNSTNKEKINKKEKVCENHNEEVLSNFETFWKAWPQSSRKTDKKAALRRFGAAFKENKGLTLETILRGLNWWKNSKGWQDEQYIPAPEVWLNKCRWAAAENTPESKPSESTSYYPRYSPLPQPREAGTTPEEFCAILNAAMKGEPLK
ncbi:hypothetical protein R83H12_00414 [Fibrobacteria bacterium R8-3-H12]